MVASDKSIVKHGYIKTMTTPLIKYTIMCIVCTGEWWLNYIRELYYRMLSRRDKLLLQPWEDRRFKDHRSKVRSALPAIDDRAPAARPHVAVKLKKCQRELDRKNKIQSDNYSLLQRLGAIMRVNRLDNHWAKPLPNFQHKVGLFYDAQSLNSRVTARTLLDESSDESYSYTNTKCYACEMKKKKYNYEAFQSAMYGDSLPSIYSN